MNLRVKGMTAKKMWRVTHVPGVAEIKLSLCEVTVKKYNEHAIWLVNTDDKGNDSFLLVTRVSPLTNYYDTELEAQTALCIYAAGRLLELQKDHLALGKRILSWVERTQKEQARLEKLERAMPGANREGMPQAFTRLKAP